MKNSAARKKLGSLIGDQEDIIRRKQLSTTELHNVINIRISKNRIREHVRVKCHSQTSAYVKESNMGPNSE